MFSIEIDPEELFDRVWAEPLHAAADRLDISHYTLFNTCRGLRIILPPHGFWRRKAIDDCERLDLRETAKAKWRQEQTVRTREWELDQLHWAEQRKAWKAWEAEEQRREKFLGFAIKWQEAQHLVRFAAACELFFGSNGRIPSPPEVNLIKWANAIANDLELFSTAEFRGLVSSAPEKIPKRVQYITGRPKDWKPGDLL
jgi:hypothetical protein